MNALQLNESELKMMKEISVIFAKYKDKTRKFGLQLSHSHFNIESDEVLYETHNKVTRTLTSTPVKKTHIKDALATAWELTEKGEIVVVGTCCEGPPVTPPNS